ncbi:MAG: DNA polymerase III subunit beta [Patescibacteria group bacterium]|nr:DNA polymerase III subunit beta [Patescibacteria group bacterium]
MNITILKEKLKEGIGVVEKISQKSLTLPILQNILFKTENNFLKLSTTNLESAVNWWGLAKIGKQGSVCSPTRFLSNFLSFLPEKSIDLSEDNFVMDLTCENYKTKIKGVNPEEFPIIPQIKEGQNVIIDNIKFCQSLSQILNVPSPSTARPEISGIYFIFENNLIKMVATDSFRLAEKKIFFDTKLSKKHSLILPQSAAKEMVSIFSEKQGDLKISFSPNQISFEYMMSETDHPQIQFISRLISGEYPNYQEIIPKKYKTEVKIQRKELLNQIKSASLFSGKINEVKLRINPKTNKVEVLSQSPDLGEYKSFFVGDIKGDDVSVSFNHRFLIDGITEIKKDKLTFELTNEDGPAALKSEGEEDYLYIIMPIKSA